MVWLMYTQESKYLEITSSIYSTAKALCIITNQFNEKTPMIKRVQWIKRFNLENKSKYICELLTQWGPMYRTFYLYHDKL